MDIIILLLVVACFLVLGICRTMEGNIGYVVDGAGNFVRALDQGVSWTPPFFRPYNQVGRDQRVKLEIKFSTQADPAANPPIGPTTVTGQLTCKFELTLVGLRATYNESGRALSETALRKAVEGLLRPAIENLGGRWTWRQLCDDPEGFRRAIPVHALAPLQVDHPEVESVSFSFSPSVQALLRAEEERKRERERAELEIERAERDAEAKAAELNAFAQGLGIPIPEAVEILKSLKGGGK